MRNQSARARFGNRERLFFLREQFAHANFEWFVEFWIHRGALYMQVDKETSMQVDKEGLTCLPVYVSTCFLFK
jgi:hypothetical protein